jgi:hypothetical protein
MRKLFKTKRQDYFFRVASGKKNFIKNRKIMRLRARYVNAFSEISMVFKPLGIHNDDDDKQRLI